MDLTVLAIAKKYADSLSLGFTSVTDLGNGVVRFELTNGGGHVDVTVPTIAGQDGEDGVSPTVTVTEITGGHKVIITDADGEHEFNVMNGQGGGGSSDVVINPVLSGDEDTAVGIEVNGEKFTFPNTNTYGFTPAQITMFEGILRAAVYSADQSSSITAFIASLNEQPVVPKVLTSITAVLNNPIVEQGQTYVPNATVTAHYDDSSSAVVTSGVNYSTIDTSTTGEKTLTISYTEGGVTKTTTATVTVTAEPVIKTLTSISATKTKVSYTTSEAFSTDDVTVTAHYSDGTSANVTASSTIGTVDITTEGNKTLDISYTEDEITKTTTIAITVTASGGEVIYTKSELICEVTTDGQKFGDSHTPWVQGASYKYEFDYEVTANEGGVTIDLRNVNGSVSDKFGITSTVGATGHIEHTMSASSTRERQAFVAKNSGYTLKLTNITITKLS